MSSTNRGGERSEADFYPTPSWPVDRLFDEPTPALQFLHQPGTWIEGGAGKGSIIRACNRRNPNILWHAAELREECRPFLEETGAKVHIGNYLSADLEWLGLTARADVNIGNPPFSLALLFVLRGLRLANRAVQLLRLGILASEDRCDFMRRNMPDTYALPNRPSFKPDGSTDSADYAWFVWERDVERSFGISRVLALTPLPVRQSARTELETFRLTELPVEETLSLFEDLSQPSEQRAAGNG